MSASASVAELARTAANITIAFAAKIELGQPKN
jgi:hypothetical protein